MKRAPLLALLLVAGFSASASAKELMLTCRTMMLEEPLKISVWKTEKDGKPAIVLEETFAKWPEKTRMKVIDDWEAWQPQGETRERKLPLSYVGYGSIDYWLIGKNGEWFLGNLDRNDPPEETYPIDCTAYATNFELERVESRQKVELYDLLEDHKAVVVNIFNTWCRPCKKETPDFVKVYKEYRERGVEFVSVCRAKDDSVEKARRFTYDYKVIWPVLFDRENEAAADYVLVGVPTNCIVLPDRSMPYCKGGELTEAELRSLLDSALK